MQMSVKKLYLGGVKEPLTEDDLKEYFSKYGAVTNAIVMKDREGQYRGYVVNRATKQEPRFDSV